MIVRALTALASPAGRRGKLSAFIFHRVLAQPDPLLQGEPDALGFEEILSWITGQFRVLAPREACERLASGTLPARAAIITFDDGYRDNVEVALPILLRHRLPAAFFIATGFLDGGIMFNDRIIEAIRRAREGRALLAQAGIGEVDLADAPSRRAAIDRILSAIKHLPMAARADAVAAIEDRLSAGAAASPMMSSAQVRQLRDAGMEIGGHTRSHPILAVLDDDEARREIESGRDDLEALLGTPPRLFAYPNGRFGKDWTAAHPPMVRRAGYSFAFTTDPGAAAAGYGLLTLPRFTPWDRRALQFELRALANIVASRQPATPAA